MSNRNTVLTALAASLAIAGCSPQPNLASTQAATSQKLPRSEAQKLEKEFNRAAPFEKEAERLLKLGDYGGAEIACRKAMKIAPRDSRLDADPGLKVLLGRILLAQGRADEAVEQFTVAEHFGGDDRTYLQMALGHLAVGNVRKARSLYDKAPTLRSSEWRNAEAEMPALRTERGLKARILMGLAFDTDHTSDYDGALSYYKQAQKLYPRNTVIAYEVAGLYKALRKFPQAIDNYAIASKSEDPYISKIAHGRIIGITNLVKQLAQGKVRPYDPNVKPHYIKPARFEGPAGLGK